MSRLLPAVWSACPALLPAFGLASGILLAGRIHMPAAWCLLVVAGALVGVVLTARRSSRLVTLRPLGRTLLVAGALVGVGAARQALEDETTGIRLAHLPLPADGSRPVLLTGRVVSPTLFGDHAVRFVVAAESVRTGGSGRLVAGRVQVTVYTDGDGPSTAPGTRPGAQAPPDLGDRIRVRGRLRAPPGRRNPADFDYGAYLARRGVVALLSVYDPAQVERLGRNPTLLERTVRGVRARVRGALQRHVRRAEPRAVLQALLIGDRYGLEQDLRARFARTGLAHLLAISGLHVMILGLTLYELLRPLLLRLRLPWLGMESVRAGVTLVVLFGYLLVSGGSPSVARAVLMTALWIGGTLLQRITHPLNLLGVAAFVLLLLRPGMLFDVGFQLSFAAVGALATLLPVLQRGLEPVLPETGFIRATADTALTSLAATLGTAPVTLYHFGQAAPAGLLLNTAAIPLTATALPAAVLAVLTDGALPAVAAAFAAAAEATVRALTGLAALGDRVLGWTLIEVYVRSPWLVAAFVAGLLALAWWPRPRLRWRSAGCALTLIAGAVWIPVLRGATSPALTVWFLDVGHGDGALVRFPNGRHLLIDAGARNDYVDQGTRTIVPHLARFGIDRLDAVLVSHPHGDHLGGVPAVLSEVSVGRLLDNGQPYRSALFARTRRLADSLGVPVHAVRAGDTLALDPAVLVEVLHPFELPTAEADANEASVVLRLAYGPTDVLFMGDAEHEAEAAIVGRYGRGLASEIVKVGHHGSRTSSIPVFVARAASDTTGPQFAVVSVDRGGRYGLPDEDVIERWRAHGVHVLSTADDGAVGFRIDAGGIERISWK